MLKLNLGCGPHTPDDWVNVDYSMGAWIAKLPLMSTIARQFKLFNLSWDKDIYLHDLRKQFPWSDNSVDVIYSSHTLEHLARHEGLNFLKECYRTLKPNGIIRIVVPDLRAIVEDYLQGEIRADKFLDVLHVHYVGIKDGPIKTTFAPFIRFPHKCMYDTPTLVQIMSDIGFQITSCSASESDIKDLTVIELPGRTSKAVIVEGKKPEEKPEVFAQQVKEYQLTGT